MSASIGRTKTARKGGSGKLFKDFDELVSQFKIQFDEPGDKKWMEEQLEEVQKASNISDPDAVDALVQERVAKAFQGAVFAECDNTPIVLPKNAIDMGKVVDKVEDRFAKEAMRTAFVFAFAVGSVTDNKYWMRIGETSSRKSLYMSLPELNETGRRSHLVHFYRAPIGTALENGFDNKLILAMKRSGVEIPVAKRKFCFPKGHWLDPANRAEIAHDLELIFQQMGEKDVQQRDYSGLKYFR